MTEENNLSVNMERAVGAEIAKTVIAEMGNEELIKIGKLALRNLTSPESNWSKDSKLDKQVRETMAKQFGEEISALMSTEEHKARMKEMAKDIVDKIIEKTQENLVENIAARLAGEIISPVNGMRYTVQQIVQEMISR